MCSIPFSPEPRVPYLLIHSLAQGHKLACCCTHATAHSINPIRPIHLRVLAGARCPVSCSAPCLAVNSSAPPVISRFFLLRLLQVHRVRSHHQSIAEVALLITESRPVPTGSSIVSGNDGESWALACFWCGEPQLRRMKLMTEWCCRDQAGGSKGLLRVLGLRKNASKGEIRKAYIMWYGSVYLNCGPSILHELDVVIG
jgi:hypothetical protein